nr:helix-turn-helix domain-containing protein [Williamsia sp. CHRR-6]
MRHSYYNRLITTNEVARLFDVAPSTVRSWVRRGHLAPARRGPRGQLFKIGLVLIAASDRRDELFRSRRFVYPD